MTVPVAAKVGIVAASVAVAAAIAIYESPEVRRVADDLRRRIAIAFHSLGDNVDPGRREPRFNRPEDAEGFYQSHDVDADEETRRRQREELMYWNARREEQLRTQRERQERPHRSRGTSFDDFLEPDKNAEGGTFVYNSGADAWNSEYSNVVRRRGNTEGARGFNAAVLSNPFSDEYGIELQEQARLLETPQSAPLQPAREEVISDIYNATPRVMSPSQTPLSLPPPLSVPAPVTTEVLFDFETHSQSDAHSDYATAVGQASEHQHDQPGTFTPASTSRSIDTASSVTLDRDEADVDEYMTAGQERNGRRDLSHEELCASIQAWAQGSSSSISPSVATAAARHQQNTSFYSSPAQSTGSLFPPPPPPPPPQSEPPSEPELISEGQLTPTTTMTADSVSVVGSEAVDVAGLNQAGDEDGGMFSDSESERGIATPTTGSWSEVASVVSESESESGREGGAESWRGL
ncbi:hypothetical protein VTK26DRAFT_3893 [Humicola hyalothermophila]